MARISYSRLSSKSQTVLPRDVREKLGVKPGDRLRYRITEQGVLLERVVAESQDDPFTSFTEWASADDDEAFAGL